jgi:SAM-dependent methyltransferase
MMTCRICGNEEANERFVVREMQLGLREEFPYVECSKCGCLQIEQVPEDLSPYYPNNYYAYQPATYIDVNPRTGLAGRKLWMVRRLLTHHFYHHKNSLTRWFSGQSSVSSEYPPWIKLATVDLGLTSRARILDVGCGTGKLLLELQQYGFTNLTGLDPFIKDDIVYENGVKVLKRHLADMTGQFDFVMLHHSFEHMPDPLAVLKQAHRLLAPGRHLLVRIPVAGSFTWRKYRVNWMPLDAPRHIFLHTRASMEVLASQSGFEIVEQFFDSDGLGHWASELYLRDIPLIDDRSPFKNRDQNTFTRAEMLAFADLDAKLNQTGEADCSGFYLRRR